MSTTNLLKITVPEATGIRDNIQGYSIADCYRAVTLNSPTTYDEVEQNLSNDLPFGQSLKDLQNLFTDYGY